MHVGGHEPAHVRDQVAAVLGRSVQHLGPDQHAHLGGVGVTPCAAAAGRTTTRWWRSASRTARARRAPTGRPAGAAGTAAPEVADHQVVLVIEADERHPTQARRPRQDRLEVGDDQVGLRLVELGQHRAHVAPSSTARSAPPAASVPSRSTRPGRLYENRSPGICTTAHVGVPVDRLQQPVGAVGCEQGDPVVAAQGLDQRPRPGRVAAALAGHPVEDGSQARSVRRSPSPTGVTGRGRSRRSLEAAWQHYRHSRAPGSTRRKLYYNLLCIQVAAQVRPAPVATGPTRVVGSGSGSSMLSRRSWR